MRERHDAEEGPDPNGDKYDDATEELNVVGPLQTALDPAALAAFNGSEQKPSTNGDEAAKREAAEGLIALNEQVGGKALHVLAALRKFLVDQQLDARGQMHLALL